MITSSVFTHPSKESNPGLRFWRPSSYHWTTRIWVRFTRSGIRLPSARLRVCRYSIQLPLHVFRLEGTALKLHQSRKTMESYVARAGLEPASSGFSGCHACWTTLARRRTVLTRAVGIEPAVRLTPAGCTFLPLSGVWWDSNPRITSTTS